MLRIRRWLEYFLGMERIKLGRWSLRADGLRKRKAWGKKGEPYLLIKAVNIMCPPRALKLAYFQGVVRNGTVGFPKPVLMRIPQ